MAVRKTRWELGRWGWYSNHGTEEQVLAEMIADELEYDIMGRAYSKLQGPWFVRNMLRNKMTKVFDSMVLAIVKPAWAGMAKTVEALKPKIEPKIKDAVEPIFKAEANIVEQMKGLFVVVSSFVGLSLIVFFQIRSCLSSVPCKRSTSTNI